MKAARGALILLALFAVHVPAAERTERFDREPAWEAHNNRAPAPPPRPVKQDFGFSQTSHAGGETGEIGGFISPAAEPAWYATKIDEATFDTPLSASGKLACTGRQFHVLVGFFND